MLWDGLTQFDKAAVYKAAAVSIRRTFVPLAGRDNPYYVRMTIEGGTQSWTNPNYVISWIGN